MKKSVPKPFYCNSIALDPTIAQRKYVPWVFSPKYCHITSEQMCVYVNVFYVFYHSRLLGVALREKCPY